MTNISLMALEASLPEDKIGNEFFGEGVKNTKNRMFMGTEYRRHINRDNNASDLIASAALKMIGRLNLDPEKDIDLIITNVSVPDQVFTGCGAVVCKKTGVKAKYVLDMHNTGCVSFVYMMELARSLMHANGYKTAMICAVQTAGGRIFSLDSTRQKAQAAIPGDGCGIGYLTQSDDSPVLGTVQHNYPDFSEDMFASNDCGRKYWEAGTSESYIDFNEAKVANIVTRGNRLVPSVVKEACTELELDYKKIDILITNQPNIFFLRNWREALELPKEKHLDTFVKYANLFGAGIPITMAEGIQEGKIKKGDLVCLAGFSHAGDYAAASLLRWGGV